MGNRMGILRNLSGGPPIGPQYGRSGLRRACLKSSWRAISTSAGLLGENPGSRAWGAKIRARAPDCPRADKEKAERRAQEGETGGLGDRSRARTWAYEAGRGGIGGHRG